MQINKKIFFSALGVNAFTILFVLVNLELLPPQVPLFYGEPLGETQLTPPLGLIIPPLVFSAVSLINYLISLKTQNVFIKQSLVITALVISILAGLSVIKIIFLVGSFT